MGIILRGSAGRDDGEDRREGGREGTYQVVVAIHDGMHGVVHSHKVEAGGRLSRVGVPAEEEDSDVVVPVQELGRGGGGGGSVGKECWEACERGACRLDALNEAGSMGRWGGRKGGREGGTCSLLLRKTIKTVSTSSGILLKMKSITHRPDAPSP